MLSLLLLFFLALPRLSQQVNIVMRTSPNANGAISIAECNDIPPGSCCRRLKLPPSNMIAWSAMVRQGRYMEFKAAGFEGLTALDLGVAWTNDYTAASRYTWTSACGGRVYGIVSGAAGSGPEQAVDITEAQSSRRGGKIVGADYIHFSESQPLMAAADGIRAFLGGGGDMFTDGRSTSSFGDASIAASADGLSSSGADSTGSNGAGSSSSNVDATNLADPGRATEVADQLAGSNSVYPDVLQIDKTRYTQQGSRTSLLYKDQMTGTILGMPNIFQNDLSMVQLSMTADIPLHQISQAGTQSPALTAGIATSTLLVDLRHSLLLKKPFCMVLNWL